MYKRQAKACKIDAADIINIKLMKCGGLYPAEKINAIAEANHVQCMVDVYKRQEKLTPCSTAAVPYRTVRSCTQSPAGGGVVCGIMTHPSPATGLSLIHI